MVLKYKVKKIKVIKNSKGNLFKMISKKDNFFNKFGEMYFSEVHPKFKGWKIHKKKNTINYCCKWISKIFYQKEN